MKDGRLPSAEGTKTISTSPLRAQSLDTWGQSDIVVIIQVPFVLHCTGKYHGTRTGGSDAPLPLAVRSRGNSLHSSKL